MKDKRLWKILGITLVALTLLWLTAIALAGPPAQGPSSSSEDSIEAIAPVVPETIGDDPDEDGYTGSLEAPGLFTREASSSDGSQPSLAKSDITLANQADEDGYTGSRGAPAPFNGEPSVSPSEFDTAAAPNWDQFFLEPQPDQDGYIPAAGISNAGFSPYFSYFHVAGTALRPRDSSVTWANTGSGGCVYQTGGSTGEIFNIHLDIPEGSRVDYLRIYYYDTSASTSYAWITSYDDAGGLDDITDVASSGTGGYGTQLSSLVSQTLDSQANSYVLNWRSNQTGSTMQLCGLRVAYHLPD